MRSVTGLGRAHAVVSALCWFGWEEKQQASVVPGIVNDWD